MTTSHSNLHEDGAKDDSGKVLGGLIGDFGLALMEVAKVGTFGANKYTRGGWESVPEGIQRYEDALWRHLLMKNIEVVDSDSGLEHELHMVWNALAVLELKMRKRDDDRASTTDQRNVSTSHNSLSSSVHSRGESERHS